MKDDSKARKKRDRKQNEEEKEEQDAAFESLMSNCDDALMMYESPTSATFSERNPSGFTPVFDMTGFSCQSKSQLELQQEKMRIIE